MMHRSQVVPPHSKQILNGAVHVQETLRVVVRHAWRDAQCHVPSFLQQQRADFSDAWLGRALSRAGP